MQLFDIFIVQASFICEIITENLNLNLRYARKRDSNENVTVMLK